MVTVAPADPDSADAALLIGALSAVLGQLTGASGAASFDASDVRAPRAVFALARDAAGMPVGCGALRALDQHTAEIKRMYARPGSRAGAAVLAYLEQQALAFGYARLCLETRRINLRAIAFYERNGYRPIPNYGRYVGQPHAVCLGKDLA